jgi:hypothetical protein
MWWIYDLWFQIWKRQYILFILFRAPFAEMWSRLVIKTGVLTVIFIWRIFFLKQHCGKWPLRSTICAKCLVICIKGNMELLEHYSSTHRCVYVLKTYTYKHANLASLVYCDHKIYPPHIIYNIYFMASRKI